VAQHVQTRLVDDLDGSKAVETITFQVDSKEYEIDLNEEHAARLRDALAPYVAAGRRAGVSRTPRRQSAAPKRSRQDLAEVRAWLAEHGYPVKERGRIPDAWVADYDTKSPNPPQQGEPTAVEAQQPSRAPAVEAPVFQAVS
jgi:nucleoid-associated protein Lsr2